MDIVKAFGDRRLTSSEAARRIYEESVIGFHPLDTSYLLSCFSLLQQAQKLPAPSFLVRDGREWYFNGDVEEKGLTVQKVFDNYFSSHPEDKAGRINSRDDSGKIKLSYKYERIRERVRSHLVEGVFHDTKLPGERELARRYGANAKTMNKALRDLAAEGLLVQRVGIGTSIVQGG